MAHSVTPALINTLSHLTASLPSRRRKQLVLLLALMIIGALAELISLGAIVPFLAILADPVQALQRPVVAQVVSTLGLNSANRVEDVRWHLTLLFAGAAVASGLVRFMLNYATAKINFGIGHELGAEVYRRTLYQPYTAHVARNSSVVMGGINKVDVIIPVIFSLLTICGGFIMAIFIITALVLIDPMVATLALLGFGGIYSAVSFFSRNRLARNSRTINLVVNTRMQSMQEGLGGIRDVLLDHSQPIFVDRFNRIDFALRQAQASNTIIGPSPRFAVEALGMVLIALLGYNMITVGGGITAAIPTLGALALGAQRLMPLLQQIYSGWVMVAGNRQVLVDVVNLLKQPVAEETQKQLKPLPFTRDIRLVDVSFRYQQHLPMVLHNIELTIPKGARVGFIGTTGSGKSTAIDLLMGLLQPSTGQILVDGIPLTGATQLAWQRNVAHVPQTIFLADASYAENIAYGVPHDQIDHARVREAAQQAQISEFIEAGVGGYMAMVGERGVRLSGGQRQRIGIARALYKQASVLVFDEATSALDSETETIVMQALNNLKIDLTVLVIAHRLTTLSNCDVIYRMDQGRIVEVGGYNEICVSTNITINTDESSNNEQ
jgi:ABC-type multidrug transport system fused ATPase/permease subunit